MDISRAGRALRAIRRHRGWTLERAAAEARTSVTSAWRIEAGRVNSARALDAYARGLGAQVDVYVRWHHGDLDRIVSGRHSAMHEHVARIWEQHPAWAAVPEVTFAHFGERGVVDWVAWHAATGTLLIVELKSEIVDVNDLLGSMNRRVRLARTIAEPYGWAPRQVAAWVAVEDTRTNRRHLARHATVLRAAFPEDGHALRPWLDRPARPLRCLSFLTTSQPEKERQASAARNRTRSLSDIALDERLPGFHRPDHDEPVSG